MQQELRLWKIYSTVTTLLIAALVLSGFQQPERKAKFSEIDVERINIVEKSGRLRMTISNQERAPDPIADGTRGTRQGGNQAGLIFFNDKGDECGGLVFGSGSTDGNTVVMTITAPELFSGSVVASGTVGASRLHLTGGGSGGNLALDLEGCDGLQRGQPLFPRGGCGHRGMRRDGRGRMWRSADAAAKDP